MCSQSDQVYTTCARLNATAADTGNPTEIQQLSPTTSREVVEWQRTTND